MQCEHDFNILMFGEEGFIFKMCSKVSFFIFKICVHVFMCVALLDSIMLGTNLVVHDTIVVHDTPLITQLC